MTMSRLAVLVVVGVAMASCLRAHGRDLSTPRVVPAMVELFRHNDTTAVEECNIVLEVKTGDYWRAGTDSKITLSLSDEGGYSFEFASSLSGLFERGDLNVITSDNAYRCDFKPCILEVVSDGTDLSPDWFCEYVFATVVFRVGRTWLVFYQTRFTPNQWIGPNTGRMSVEINQCASAMAVA